MIDLTKLDAFDKAIVSLTKKVKKIKMEKDAVTKENKALKAERDLLKKEVQTLKTGKK